MWTNRGEAEARLQALVADFLDSQEESTDAEIHLGVLAIVAEIRERNTPEEIAEGRVSEDFTSSFPRPTRCPSATNAVTKLDALARFWLRCAMPGAGLEPARPEGHPILSPLPASRPASAGPSFTAWLGQLRLVTT